MPTLISKGTFVSPSIYTKLSILGRLQDAIVSREMSSTTLMDALKSLCLLRSTLHAYNKGIAEVSSGHPLLHHFFFFFFIFEGNVMYF